MSDRNKKSFIIFMLMLSSAFSIGCRSDENKYNFNSDNSRIIGAGASFPFPLYQRMFQEYNKEKGIEITYKPIGSGAGINQLILGTVDFAGTDVFLSQEDLKKTARNILYIPTCLGAVAITYNLQDNPVIKITGDILAKIFAGEIVKWNDPEIASINSGLSLPDLPITIIYRSDGSGTTFILSDYLSKSNEFWKKKFGRGKNIFINTGIGGKGNAGVVELIKRIPGAIGYAEVLYTVSNKMPVALIKNSSGNFVPPDTFNITKSAEKVIDLNWSETITDTESPSGYPISGFSWILVFREQDYNNRNPDHIQKLKSFLKWIVLNSSKYTSDTHYGDIPEPLKMKSISVIDSITFSKRTE